MKRGDGCTPTTSMTDCNYASFRRFLAVPTSINGSEHTAGLAGEGEGEGERERERERERKGMGRETDRERQSRD